MPNGTVKTETELETQIDEVIKGNILDNNKTSSPNHRVLLRDIKRTMFAILDSKLSVSGALGTFKNGFWYAGDPDAPVEGDQRLGIISEGQAKKWAIDEYVSGDWLRGKITF